MPGCERILLEVVPEARRDELSYPGLRRVVTFYDPSNAIAMAGAKWAREAARQLKIEIFERHVASVEERRRGLTALKAQDADELAASVLL